MNDVQKLFDYIGTCLHCGKTWTLSQEELNVIIDTGCIAYSQCCIQPATIVKRKAKREHLQTDHQHAK